MQVPTRLPSCPKCQVDPQKVSFLSKTPESMNMVLATQRKRLELFSTSSRFCQEQLGPLRGVASVVLIGLGIRKRVLDLEGERLAGDIDLTRKVTNALRLDKETLQQFIRATHAFTLGIQAGATDLALSYLLLVTSVECLSSLESYIPNSELNRDNKSVERYVRFIREFCSTPEEFYDEKGEEGFIQNLKTVYYRHRSGFVHSGKEVPSAASSTADDLGIPSITHYVGGKQITTPGLMWFSRVVRRSVVGFLEQSPKRSESGRDVLQEVAARRGMISLPMA